MDLYHRDNPRRPVDWRWERSKIALARGISRRRDDAWVCKAARFKQDFDACRIADDFYALADKHPDMVWAHDIATNSGADGNPLKSAIEARILARDDWGRIAKRARAQTGVIEAYEAVFFNVQSELDNEDYILHQVIGPALHPGFQEQDYDLVWKLVGYKGGPDALDAMIGVVGDVPRPQSRAEVGAWMADVTRRGLKRKALLATHVLRLNNFNAAEVIDRMLKLVELERDAPGGGVNESMLANVGAMMTSLGEAFTVGRRPVGVDASPPAAFDGVAAELRGDELIALAAGRGLPHGPELVALAFPEPRGRDEGFPGGGGRR